MKKLKILTEQEGTGEGRCAWWAKGKMMKEGLRKGDLERVKRRPHKSPSSE
jgi:hypothetical protein